MKHVTIQSKQGNLDSNNKCYSSGMTNFTF